MAASQSSGGGRDFRMCECNEKQLGAVKYGHDNNNYCEFLLSWTTQEELTGLKFVLDVITKVPNVT